MPLLFDSGPNLQADEFRLIRDHINEFCGISFQDDALFMVERRLRDRLKALGINSFSQYYHHLRYHFDAAAETERAIELLTTNETYFFREDYQLRAFSDEVLPQIYDRGRSQGTRRLSIWSAGCSTGEEVYTIAILVAHSRLFQDWEVRVFGNDISRQVLQTARRATYGPGSFRTMPPGFDRYFTSTAEGRQVIPAIRAMCHFGHLNLLDRERAALVGRVDVIFCRNVLIYFDPVSRRHVIEGLYDRLVPGGYLLLGHSESLLNLSTSFELVHLNTDLVYRRPGPVSQPPGWRRRAANER